MKEYIIFVGLTRKLPLDQYEQAEIQLGLTVKVEADKPPKLTKDELKKLDEAQAEMTGILKVRSEHEQGVIVADWLERGKLKDLRTKYEEEKAAELALEASKEMKKGKSLLGPPPED